MNDPGGVEILLVDDSAEDTELIVRSLRRGRVKNPIFCAHTGEEALAHLAEVSAASGRRPGLVLLDLKMPLMGGVEVVQRLKADPLMATIPVVILTSSVAHRDMIESYNLGVSGYLIKPVRIESFVEIVAQLGLARAIGQRATDR